MILFLLKIFPDFLNVLIMLLAEGNFMFKSYATYLIDYLYFKTRYKSYFLFEFDIMSYFIEFIF